MSNRYLRYGNQRYIISKGRSPASSFAGGRLRRSRPEEWFNLYPGTEAPCRILIAPGCRSPSKNCSTDARPRRTIVAVCASEPTFAKTPTHLPRRPTSASTSSRCSSPTRRAGKSPPPTRGRGNSRSRPIDVVVHSSYSINVASLNNRLRMPSRKAVEQQAAAAAGVGRVRAGRARWSPARRWRIGRGLRHWHKLFDRRVDKGGFRVPILIENTAGGDHAMARTSNPSTGSGQVGDFEQAGFCLDTCHAWAGGAVGSGGPGRRVRRSPAASTWCI